MITFIKYAFTWIVEALADFWEASTMLVNYLISSLFSSIFSTLPAEYQDGSIMQLDMAHIDSFSGAVEPSLWDGILWLFPIADAIVVLSAGFVVVLGIRVVRWALGLIPTLSLG